MDVKIHNEYQFHSQLYRTPEASNALLASRDATTTFGELVDEAWTCGLLSEQIPSDAAEVGITITPIWRQEPLVDAIQVSVTAESGAAVYSRRFASGPWVREAQLQIAQLRQEGTLGETETAYFGLKAIKNGGDTTFKLPPLQPPLIVEQTLQQLGVQRLGEGDLMPERPILVNQRVADDGVRLCEQAGLVEAGGAVLGKIIRLPEPLPGTTTRTVTVLTSLVEDERHLGQEASFEVSPEGLQRAATIADLRGLNERVVTIFHTHGWSPKCGNCNRSETCPLPKCEVSVQDYILLQTLFSGKDTLMPISGRELGAQGDHPVFRVFAWNGGEMRSVRWRAYFD